MDQAEIEFASRCGQNRDRDTSSFLWSRWLQQEVELSDIEGLEVGRANLTLAWPRLGVQSRLS